MAGGWQTTLRFQLTEDRFFDWHGMPGAVHNNRIRCWTRLARELINPAVTAAAAYRNAFHFCYNMPRGFSSVTLSKMPPPPSMPQLQSGVACRRYDMGARRRSVGSARLARQAIAGRTAVCLMQAKPSDLSDPRRSHKTFQTFFWPQSTTHGLKIPIGRHPGRE
jgi:hypothetical protein